MEDLRINTTRLLVAWNVRIRQELRKTAVLFAKLRRQIRIHQNP